jgi:hypothetical protein
MGQEKKVKSVGPTQLGGHVLGVSYVLRLSNEEGL